MDNSFNMVSKEIKRSAMKSDKINKAIRRIEDIMDKNDKWIVKGLEDTGKCIPYIGWCWRDLDWDAPSITFGVLPDCNDPLELTKGFIGFMKYNKWDYEQFVIQGEAKDTLRKMVENTIVSQSDEKFQALFDYIQSLRPTSRSLIERWKTDPIMIVKKETSYEDNRKSN